MKGPGVPLIVSLLLAACAEPRPRPVVEIAPAAPSPKIAAAPPPKPAPPLPVATNLASVDGVFGAKHLVVMYQGALRAPQHVTRTKDEARALAAEALGKIRAGLPFEDAVVQYSDEPGAAARRGDLGTFRAGMMVAEFQAAVERLQVGEVSGVVETKFGFHVIVRTQ